MDDKKEENLSTKNFDFNLEKLKEHYASLKNTAEEFLINSPFLIKAQDSTKDFLKNYFINPTMTVLNTNLPEIKNIILNNQIVKIPLTIIENSNYKNLIEVKLFDTNYQITYTDRKVSVIALTFTGVIAHYLRSNMSKFRLRWLIPYYVFFSLILCRENLDPYGS